MLKADHDVLKPSMLKTDVLKPGMLKVAVLKPGVLKAEEASILAYSTWTILT